MERWNNLETTKGISYMESAYGFTRPHRIAYRTRLATS